MIIKINNLTKSFGDKKIFDNFTAEIDINGILVIKGASGLGKTTLLRIIAGLDKHYRGEIKKPDGEISFMFQEDRLIPFVSVLKNLAAVSNEETALRYLRLMGLESEKHSPPSSLSGGMKRRVALARALCFRSSLVILDEPFKGLDERLKKDICALIREESKTRDFIIVSHDSEERELLNAEIFDLSDL